MVDWVTGLECCVDTTTVLMRTGTAVSYSMVTWLFASGRSQLTRPALRSSASLRRTSLCDSAMRRGHELGRLVDREAEHQALVAGALLGWRPSPSFTPWAMSGLWRSMAVKMAQVLPSKPISELVYPMSLHHRAHHVGKLDARGRGDLTGDDDEAGLDHRLAGDAGRGSSVRIASRIASETWSQTLSGCPSLTDSEVNWVRAMNRSCWRI
jgi:hypothetical protein